MRQAPTDSLHSSLDEAFAREVKRATRESGRMLGALALAVVPAWGVVDLLLEPANAPFFIGLRVAAVALMAALLLVLRRGPFGRSHPELLTLAILSVIQILIALQIPRVEVAHGVYATGASLAIYASAFMLVWHWRYPAMLIGVTVVALLGAYAVTPDPSNEPVAGVAFYLATAAVVAVAGQWYRHKLAWNDFCNRAALEREQARNQRLVERLERLTRTDELTGLANRRSWDALLAREWEQRRGDGDGLAVLIADLDGFKGVNDRHGHPAGDHVLRSTAALVAAELRDDHLAARLGGDEFAVLCPRTDWRTAIVLAERLAHESGRAALPDGRPAGTRLSVGVAVYEPDDESAADVVARADRDLYRVKQTRSRITS